MELPSQSDEPTGEGASEQNWAALWEAVHKRLRQTAQKLMRTERLGHTLQATALVHQACLCLHKYRCRPDWTEQKLLAAAAKTMRRVLVDHARIHNAKKRCPPGERFPLDSSILFPEGDQQVDLLDLDAALDRLAAVFPNYAQVVELRYFGGFSEKEAATLVGASLREVKNWWRSARTWLKRELTRPGGEIAAS